LRKRSQKFRHPVKVKKKISEISHDWYQKTQNFMLVSKIQTYLCDKMHLKKMWLFGREMWLWPGDMALAGRCGSGREMWLLAGRCGSWPGDVALWPGDVALWPGDVALSCNPSYLGGQNSGMA
jgi:hypothetical protein